MGFFFFLQELEELKNQLHLNQPDMERAGDPDASYYTSEDTEKIEKHCLENGLRMVAITIYIVMNYKQV